MICFSLLWNGFVTVVGGEKTLDMQVVNTESKILLIYDVETEL